MTSGTGVVTEGIGHGVVAGTVVIGTVCVHVVVQWWWALEYQDTVELFPLFHT